jgi:hypothetical protein
VKKIFPRENKRKMKKQLKKNWKKIEKKKPTVGLEPTVSPLGGVRRIHWATQAGVP